ncbi:16S rRNA (guanine(966)-N(2))-methyltransferase RsmD [Edaphobacter flagellatus]|uniref:16S rRNA (guanine(966)-N(2))-methyltransferase RsmD n=1 Tax=Edaphobacter flagellatus TaxID=1933044 RepID=UPI0021B1C525|nr:16S rRNA (guanine(966)-N(2))-methyltransferase RsmD [Edaphobacter flagellatus]
MRVIAGEYRSRPLSAPRGTKTRPTSDRLRETLFNVIAPHIAGAHFADLYAGSGAVGIEALSRGAQRVWFADNATPAIKAIRENLAALEINARFSIENRGTAVLLDALIKNGTKLDLIFLDPPYESHTEYVRTLGFLGSAKGRPLLAEDARVIAEHRSKDPLEERYGALQRVRVLKQGDAALSFYALAPESESAG